VNGEELNIKSIQLTYDGQQIPAVRAVSGHGVANPDNSSLLQQLYWNGMLARRSDDAQGGAESYNTWLTRGPIVSTFWARDAASRAVDLQLYLDYGDRPGGGFDINSKVFVAAIFDKTTEVSTQDGMIVAVRSLNV